MRTYVTDWMANAENHAADAAAPMKPANNETRHARSVRTTTSRERHHNHPPSTSVCKSCATTTVSAALRSHDGVPATCVAAR